MARKGVRPKINLFQLPAKIRPIPRGRDNTDDLEDAAQAVHSRFSHLRAPVGTKSKSANKGSFDPADNTAFNGNTVTGP